MRYEVAKQWVNALRSGKFTQGKGALADHAREKYCCLGVLCEIAIQNGIKVKRLRAETLDETSYDDCAAFPPPPIMAWAGLRTENVQLRGAPYDSLIGMNDGGGSFEEIADLIEEKWEEI